MLLAVSFSTYTTMMAAHGRKKKRARFYLVVFSQFKERENKFISLDSDVIERTR